MRTPEPAATPLSVTNFTFQGFRGFKEVTHEAQRLNVFVGLNGQGKSALLAGVAICLSRFTAPLASSRGRGRPILKSDIRIGSKLAGLLLTASLDGVDYTFGTFRSPAWVSEHDQLGSASSNGADGAKVIRDRAAQLRTQIETNPSYSLPLVASYSVNRAVLDVPLRIRTKHTFDQSSAFENDDGGSSFRRFFEWFRQREDLEAEKLRDTPGHVDAQLASVRTAIEVFLEGYSNLRVRRLPLRMTVTKGKLELDIRQLSDGEKSLIGLIGDIARRLAMLNPSLSEPLRGTGIVLIDELELHLHPQWQRRVIEFLPKVFPNVQFFATTHSVVVANATPIGSLFLVRNGKVEPALAYGQDASVVLGDLFQTTSRPTHIDNRISELFRTIEQDPAKAERLLTQIEKVLTTQDEAVVRARSRLARIAK